MAIESVIEPPEPGSAFLFAVDALQHIQSSMAALAAMEMTLLSTVFTVAEQLTADLASPVSEREMALRSASAEIAAALRISDRTVQRRMSDAWGVVNRFPRVLEALSRGEITAAHVAVILRASDVLDTDESREQYERAALERAATLSPGRLEAVLGSIASDIQQSTLVERHQRARAERRVEICDLPDGMSELTAVLPSVLAHGIYDRLTSMAHSIKKAGATRGSSDELPTGEGSDDCAVSVATSDAGDAEGVTRRAATDDTSTLTGQSPSPTALATVDEHSVEDSRTADQLRADVLADVMLGGAPVAHGDGLAAISAQVQVSIPVLTLAGVTEGGAELVGVGPIDPAIASELAGASSSWTRVMTHPMSGEVLAVDRYRPSEDLRRHLRVRDEHCRFPGCRQPAHRCDADHSLAAVDGGPTEANNLALLCRRHHVMKHAAHWTITQHSGGVLTWTSPSGREYVDRPTSMVRFMPTPGAP